MNIFSLLNNDTSELSEEERELVESFNEEIREKPIEALAECEVNELINELNYDENAFREKLTDIFINGKKGYIKMPTKALIDIFLDKKDEGEFINLIESLGGI